MSETRPTYEQIKHALDVAFEAYRQHVPYGEGWNEAAIKARDAAYAAALGKPLGAVDTETPK